MYWLVQVEYQRPVVRTDTSTQSQNTSAVQSNSEQFGAISVFENEILRSWSAVMTGRWKVNTTVTKAMTWQCSSTHIWEKNTVKYLVESNALSIPNLGFCFGKFSFKLLSWKSTAKDVSSRIRQDMPRLSVFVFASHQMPVTKMCFVDLCSWSMPELLNGFSHWVLGHGACMGSGPAFLGETLPEGISPIDPYTIIYLRILFHPSNSFRDHGCCPIFIICTRMYHCSDTPLSC